MGPDDRQLVAALGLISREFAHARTFLAVPDHDFGARPAAPARPPGRLSKMSRVVEAGLGRLSGAVHPAHPEWATTALDDRVAWWATRLGSVVAAAAAIPAAGGRLTASTGVQSAIGATGQGLMVCAVGHELGVEDRARQVTVMSEVVLGCRLEPAEVSRLLAAGGEADASTGPTGEPRVQWLLRLSQQVRGVGQMLDARPVGTSRLARLGKNVPGAGAVSGFMIERSGVKLAAEQAVPAFRRLI